ncbi:alanyl-tRNA editing protein [Legionella pneumophila]|uniref:alanyl-tRNA editing protein n=1 Tax=Legionella pneumophila TaxID=446 RepID=UPI0005A9E21D|nr:alanyl-tRNA editing protein [Legionella pneumophila]PYB49536.1 alanyl-tRNA editing protein [Legionella pneumophila]PYB53249.1 alanyl-tRNA editing protein [Legionella pneumophila]PYB57049.1 alanyl-tRNA editing protein [Legionella pneumophila]TID48733.1 alanyl-tRNA editing protein [Legionella pneumophila]TIE44494.1 alanyl-tRNA editing protein [Legionella pneumophila]
MEKIFWSNPYQHTLDTKIISINGNEILLEKTIAFSFSGGQESDRAFINGLEVLSSRIDGNLIYYTLPDDHNLAPNDVITMTIDWPRRHRLMRLHFAAELILELVTRTSMLEKVGAHISESKARIDFKANFNISSIFSQLLDEYNVIIKQDLVIHKGYHDVTNQRRFWKIDGFAEVPCGGTHVHSTSEVGFIRLKRSHPGKAIERIEITLMNDSR